jgi:hypothetical protein
MRGDDGDDEMRYREGEGLLVDGRPCLVRHREVVRVQRRAVDLINTSSASRPGQLSTALLHA